jgi:hypothetical protein
VTHGCRGVKLDAWKRGGLWYTTMAKVEKFRIDCTQPRTTWIRTPKQQQRDSEAARQMLILKHGIGRKVVAAAKSPLGLDGEQ